MVGLGSVTLPTEDALKKRNRQSQTTQVALGYGLQFSVRWSPILVSTAALVHERKHIIMRSISFVPPSGNEAQQDELTKLRS